MPVIPIRTIPDPILRKKSKKVKSVDGDVRQVITDLLETLESAKEPEGAGLAAPQLGVSQRIVIVREFLPNPQNPDEILSRDHVLINPRIISASKETQTIWEGCLSVPDTYGKVERPEKIKVRALDQDGNVIQFKASGYFSSVVQHEMDHLDGILFTDKVTGKTISEEELEKLGEEVAI